MTVDTLGTVTLLKYDKRHTCCRFDIRFLFWLRVRPFLCSMSNFLPVDEAFLHAADVTLRNSQFCLC